MGYPKLTIYQAFIIQAFTGTVLLPWDIFRPHAEERLDRSLPSPSIIKIEEVSKKLKGTVAVEFRNMIGDLWEGNQAMRHVNKAEVRSNVIPLRKDLI